MVLMAAIAGVQKRSEFSNSLTRDPPKDIDDFYSEAKRFLRQEDASLEMESLEVLVAKQQGPLNGNGQNKGRGMAPEKDKRNV